METLQSFREILECNGLTDKAYVLVMRCRIPCVFIRLYFICILMVDSILQFCACVKMYQSNIHAALLSLHVALSTLSGVAIYVNLIIKIGEILELIDYLMDIFDKRKPFSSFEENCSIIIIHMIAVGNKIKML